MHVLSRPRLRIACVGTVAAVGLALSSSALAATPLTAAVPNQFNSTPDCPVSASSPVCAWNVTGDGTNVFGIADYGECPYWAAEKYPSLVLDEVSSDALGQDWDGFSWLEHAQSEGLAVSATPASGDLAVWPADADDPAGHVAYVEAVEGDAIIVSQMDGASSAPFPAMQGSTEYIPAVDLAYFQADDGLQFVQTGDPSTTPLSYLEPAPAPTPAPATATTIPVPAASPSSPPPVSPKPARHGAGKRRGHAKPRATRPSHRAKSRRGAGH